MSIIREDFIGFTFCGIHSSKYQIMSVTNGSRYSQSLFANFSDSTEHVMGMDGTYYFGTDIETKPYTLHCFVDHITESQLRGLQAWLHPKKIGKLSFDEAPYKYYTVKVTQTPVFDFVPSGNSSGNIYAGEFDLEFQAFDPFGYSYANSIDDFNYDSEPSWYYDSGILYAGYTPPFIAENIIANKNILLYNAGNANAKPIISITGTADVLTILNNTTGQYFTLTGMSSVITIVVDSNKGRCMVGEYLANSYHTGGYIEIAGSNGVDYYSNVNFTNGSPIVSLIEGEWEETIVGRWIALGDNNWYKVVSLTSSTAIILDKNFTGTTGVHNVSVIDLNEISITGVNLNLSNINFSYKHTYL